jgi:hypothetical protein
MPLINLIFIWLAQKLYPNGRAFRMPEPKQTGQYYTDEGGVPLTDEDGNFLVTEDYSVSNGYLWRLHRAISIQFAIAWNGITGVSNAQLPDNPNFTQADANDWYRRWGLYNSGSISFADMIAALKQRASWPAVPLNKQNYLYIQGQLQAAGFNVAVYENRFPSGGTFITKTPAQIYSSGYPLAEAGVFESGDTEFGTGESSENINMLANYVEAANDAGIDVTNLRSTFFVAAPSAITNFATVPAAREIEFRQLLLKLKSQHTIGYLAINFT